MGAYSPAPVLTDAIAQSALDKIVRPTMAEMVRRGTPYQGVLYVGLMIKDGQPRLVEYNVRFGDPECQVLMMRLGGQALDLMLACTDGRLDQMQVNWADDHAMTVVMAAKGYPGGYAKHTEINGVESCLEDSFHMVFHAGTVRADGRLLANGGLAPGSLGRHSAVQTRLLHGIPSLRRLRSAYGSAHAFYPSSGLQRRR